MRFIMNNSEKIFAQIKMLSSHITENTYYDRIQQGYALLTELHDMNLEQKDVYQPLYEYHNSLNDGLFRDYIADLLDYVAGWCPLQYRIWND